MNKRDDFTPKTKEILAKRVGFICSNPNCRVATIGPHTDRTKSLNIGNAAHISAASSGGPRYDEKLTSAQRKHIDNGIWLCSNCATQIDTDKKKYDKELLIKWKLDAENKQTLKLEYKVENKLQISSEPYLEADLIFASGLSTPLGYSPKNQIEEVGENVNSIVNKHPIQIWNLDWDFVILIHNNSSCPALNVTLKPQGNKKFTQISKLKKINNIQPYKHIEVKSSYSFKTEETGSEASEKIRKSIPDDMIGLEMNIDYIDESRNSHCSTFKILENKEIENIKKIC
ncbi:MAG: hypothetical protein GQ564_13950 [Bacteroidales bacterium]|nr:hypothetical protein [Bacteroidales bacterium]